MFQPSLNPLPLPEDCTAVPVPTFQVVKDSISPEGQRLTSIHVKHPRMIHADFMTHRVFSRNGRSSRAVPSLTKDGKPTGLLVEPIYVPHFRKNRPGMVGTEEFSPEELAAINSTWIEMARDTRAGVLRLLQAGVHKQWANRPLEWFGYIDVLVTSTEWENYFHLRCKEAGDAQPEIIAQAEIIRDLLAASTPELLKPGQWHLPYVEIPDLERIDTYLGQLAFHGARGDLVTMTGRKLSASRCARLSIRPFDGNDTIEAELNRFDRLYTGGHWSPMEHQATPDEQIPSGVAVRDGAWVDLDDKIWKHAAQHRNFTGWRQFRAILDVG